MKKYYQEAGKYSTSRQNKFLHSNQVKIKNKINYCVKENYVMLQPINNDFKRKISLVKTMSKHKDESYFMKYCNA